MSRPAMRLLSSRLRCLHRLDVPLPPAVTNARLASRYSNPTGRAAVNAPSQPSSFVDTDADVDRPVDQLRNPLDTVNAQREYVRLRNYHLKRMRFAGIGLLLSISGLAAVLYNIDLDDLEQSSKKSKTQLDAPQDSKDKFQGRDVHIIGAGEDKRIVAEGEQETNLVETGTSSVPYFPRTLYLPSSSDSAIVTAAPTTSANPGNVRNEEEYTLVGLGIRTVSFLSIQVYVLGFYVCTQDISALQARLIHHVNREASTLVPAEKEELRKKLLDPTTSTEIWQQLLTEKDIKSAWRIVPTRNTDFAHLRDGWITGIKRGTTEAAALAKAHASGPIQSEYESESFGNAVKNFKDLFVGGGRAPKGSVIMLVRDGAGSLEILFQDQGKTDGLERLGRVQDPRIGRLVWLGYLAGKNVSSEPARKGVVEGCVAFAGRPVGTVETMVT